ncbi:MAG: tetratricopeptide repeat protein [Acidobacteria bacterium]|nr:tetratricopeptide repeat protein [Acidobacteriota bacterium]
MTVQATCYTFPEMNAYLVWIAASLLGTPLYTLEGRLRYPSEQQERDHRESHSRPHFMQVLLETSTGKPVMAGHADPDLKFKFSRVPQGQYYLVAHDRHYEARQTVEVTKSFADPRGRIRVDVLLRPVASAEGQTVSFLRLKVAPKALELYQKAERALLEGEEGRAVRYLEEAIALSPEFSEALNSLGTHYHRAGLYSRSIQLFRRAIEGDPKAFAAHVNLGGSLVSAGRYQEAVDANGQALALRPDDALANAQMGIGLYHLGRHEAALPYLEKAKQSDPSSPTYPQLFLAEIFLARGRKEEAARQWEDYLQRHPDAPDAARIRGKLQALDGGKH